MAELNNKADESNSKTFLELFNIKMILTKFKKNGRSFASSVCNDGDYSCFSAAAGLKGKMIAYRLDDLYECDENDDGKEHKREVHAFIAVG